MPSKLSFGALLPFFLGTLASPVPAPADLSRLTERNSALNAFLSLLTSDVPSINDTLTDASSVITDLDNVLADALSLQTTQNGLGGSCTEYTVLFARGTSEPGNVGVLVGPPLFMALQSVIDSSDLTLQGVNDYSASIAGYLEGGDPSGSSEMASQIEQAYSSCPNTKLIVSAYSQGCQLVHNAIGQIPAATASWISSVLLFGDPDDGQALPNVDSSKVNTVCHDGDDICQDGDFILPAHLTYAEDVTSAASFALSAAS